MTLIDDPHYVCPLKQDILLTDMVLSDLNEVVEQRWNIKPLSPSTSSDQTFFSGHVLFNRRCIVLLPVKGTSGTYLDVPFIVDTGSPYTYLSRRSLQSLHKQLPDQEQSFVLIHKTRVKVYESPPKSHFADFNILGGDFFEASQFVLSVNFSAFSVKLVIENDDL
ncbi:hypothetical protein RCL1_002679 [Eukaryota sp. TZLM3-RCL]